MKVNEMLTVYSFSVQRELKSTVLLLAGSLSQSKQLFAAMLRTVARPYYCSPRECKL